ncbi:DUF4158 domain-containing protein (plasmid) [Phormidium sp. CLA17]|uniref:DUF4158 domain-containing protein n=1 Tax=Leptolyngbya sp. Cla-17 TaxID=2803751 RepID=UPI001490DE38|nr:DUF4158 domain-containing protein [Leptolyngbya sp. Cla-17]MBM0745221.1 DUF4158 domain-containing protein [Leptolyngbya sp. Cla-17]
MRLTYLVLDYTFLRGCAKNPTFKSSLPSTELDTLYTPSAAEVAFAQVQARTRSRQLSVLVLLKAFQRLGYFPVAAAIPADIIQHLRAHLQLRYSIAGGFSFAAEVGDRRA